MFPILATLKIVDKYKANATNRLQVSNIEQARNKFSGLWYRL